MHEVALCTQLARIVQRAAAGREVESIRLDIGALRQIVPETMRTAWSVVSRSFPGLEGAKLEIAYLPAQVACERAHLRLIDDIAELYVPCSECGGAVSVVGGEEFRVVDISVVDTHHLSAT